MEFAENMARAEALMRAPGDCSFVIRHGAGRVMFSAPHCVEQTREGRRKSAEPQTGLLAEMLHHACGCPIIRKVSHRHDDANYDPVSDYKQALADYVKERHIALLIDLHQLAPTRDVMINFGTGNGENLPDRPLLNVFLSAFTGNTCGIIQLDEPFAATYPHTVSSTIHRVCGIPCLQLEINSRLLRREYAEYAPQAVYRALCDCHRRLTEIYANGGSL